MNCGSTLICTSGSRNTITKKEKYHGRIVLIDDMKGVRRTVSTVLKRAGHNVTEADEGGAGLKLLKGGAQFDLVITNMLMPKHDGVEVLLFLEQIATVPRCW